MNLLVAIPTSSEIRDVLSDMPPLKSLGPDGLHAEFFQKQWHVVVNAWHDPWVTSLGPLKDYVRTADAFAHTLASGTFLA
ncbi:hypothetical protein V6N12_046558 [Hibiscus sabdariffa]|uniref:Uncharacterized protein n=1 Tax=Hibiscus sabdariffa TaxID=183260 RepID=A0ABR2DIZ5_9ROSI